MKQKTINKETGDTLIEVLLSIAVVGIIVVVAYAMMARGTGATQAALEQTVVRQHIDGQVEMLTYARDQAVSSPESVAGQVWRNQILAAAGTSAPSPYGACIDGTTPAGLTRFYLVMEHTTTPPPAGHAVQYRTGPIAPTAIASEGRGIWIEAHRPTGSDYVDFHIFACWSSPTSGPNLTTGTVVRLYVP